MTRLSLVTLLTLSVGFSINPTAVYGVESKCATETQAAGGMLITDVACTAPSAESADPPAHEPDFPDLTEDHWVPICEPSTDSPSGYDPICGEQHDCHGKHSPWNRIGLEFGKWTSTTVCRATPRDPRPTITPATIATAFRRIPLPSLRSIAQPGDKTLVNFDTIFHADAETLHREIRLLGQDVELTISPSRFRWSFGDGIDQVTTTPGAAYPAKTLIHRYERAHVTVRHHVEVTWTATWRVNGGPWQDVPGAVTLDGPATPLRIAEAVPLLSDPDH